MGKETFDLKYFTNGVYFIELQKKNEKRIFKLIKTD